MRSLRPQPAVAMGIATAVSRASGFARTVALAGILGVTAVGDAYNTANTVPNMVFTLVVGGVLTSAVVPILVEAHHSGHGTTGAANALLGGAIAIGMASSVAVALAAPFIVGVLTAGASSRSGYDEYAAVTTTWLRWFAPQIGLYAVGVLAVSIMTAQRRLFLGAAAPILTNLIVIAVVAAAAGRPGSIDVNALGAGTTLAVAAATAVQLWGARRTVPGLRPRWEPRHPALTGIGKRAGWMLLYVAANQIGLIVVVAIATRTRGGVSAYQWAFTVMQLPYALIAVSIVSAAYPAISEAAATGSGAGRHVRDASVSSLRLLVPAAAALALLAGPIAVVVVGSEGSGLVAAALVGFALSLVPFTLFQLLTRVAYAHRDTRTPAGVNVAVNAFNIVAAIVLVGAARSASQSLTLLAVAHAGSYIVGVVVLGALLIHRRRLAVSDLARGHRVTAVATLAMSAAVWSVMREASGAELDRAGAVTLCAGLTVLGAAVYSAATIAQRSLTARTARWRSAAALPEP